MFKDEYVTCVSSLVIVNQLPPRAPSKSKQTVSSHSNSCLGLYASAQSEKRQVEARKIKKRNINK